MQKCSIEPDARLLVDSHTITIPGKHSKTYPHKLPNGEDGKAYISAGIGFENFNWEFPHNFAQGHLHVYLEVIEMPNHNRTFRYWPILTFGQMPDTWHAHWWHGDRIQVKGPGIHTGSFVIHDYGTDFPEHIKEDAWRNPDPPSVSHNQFRYPKGVNQGWMISFDDSDYYPMKVRIIWVVVSKEGSFSGWKKYTTNSNF